MFFFVLSLLSAKRSSSCFRKILGGLFVVFVGNCSITFISSFVLKLNRRFRMNERRLNWLRLMVYLIKDIFALLLFSFSSFFTFILTDQSGGRLSHFVFHFFSPDVFSLLRYPTILKDFLKSYKLSNGCFYSANGIY